MPSLAKVIETMPGHFKGASFYNNQFGLRVLLDDSDLSPYCFHNAIHKAKEIISSFVDGTEVYIIKVYRINSPLDAEAILKSFEEKNSANQINYIEHLVQPYEKFEEDFEAGTVVNGLYVLYKTILTQRVLVNLLWDPLSIWFDGSLAFDPKNPYDLYVLNYDCTISMHPYDHRGADILCTDIEIYRQTFFKLKDSLFEHDLELMRKRLKY